MGSLQFITALRFGAASESDDALVLLNLETIREVHLCDKSLLVNNQLLCRAYIIGAYILWLLSLPDFNVFISYRHLDKDRARLLYHELLCLKVGSEQRAVKVFLDEFRLQQGQQFQKAYAKALINSSIVVPFLSAAALRNMLNHDPNEEDNLLIEWILALECMKYLTQSKVRAIYPLFFGESDANGSVGNLFDERVINELPDIVPRASIDVAKRLLEENGITMDPNLTNTTVLRVVREISCYFGLRCWENINDIWCSATDTILNELESIIKCYVTA